MIQQEKTANVDAADAGAALLKAATFMPANADISALRLVRVRSGEFRLEYVVNVDPLDARRERPAQTKLPRRSVLGFERKRVEEMIQEHEATLTRLRSRLAIIEDELDSL